MDFHTVSPVADRRSENKKAQDVPPVIGYMAGKITAHRSRHKAVHIEITADFPIDGKCDIRCHPSDNLRIGAAMDLADFFKGCLLTCLKRRLRNGIPTGHAIARRNFGPFLFPKTRFRKSCLHCLAGLPGRWLSGFLQANCGDSRRKTGPVPSYVPALQIRFGHHDRFHRLSWSWFPAGYFQQARHRESFDLSFSPLQPAVSRAARIKERKAEPFISPFFLK